MGSSWRMGDLGNTIQGTRFLFTILVFTLFFAVCQSGQINNSALDIHPVAKGTLTIVPTTVVAQPDHGTSIIIRSSSRRSLSSPISVPTISNAKRKVEAVMQNSSLDTGTQIKCKSDS